MPLKHLTSKAKRPLEEDQSSKGRANNPQPGPSQPTKQQRVLFAGEQWSLLQDFSHFDLEWMLNIESLQVRDFLNAKLAAYPTMTSDDEVDIGPFIVNSSSLCICTGCGQQDTKDEMVKCRIYHLWYHFSHFHIKDRSDPCRRFWKCITCQKNHPGGPTMETVTNVELDEDDRFEDSEIEDLD